MNNLEETESEQNSQNAGQNDPDGASGSVESEQLKAQAGKIAELQDMLLRTAADFDNYKKRVAREKQDAAKYGSESILQRLIPVLDNFEMAAAAAGDGQTASVQSLQTGVNMILQQLKSALKDLGLEPIEAVGQKFDPNIHEALSQQETPEVPEGQVVQQLRRGYRLRDRLLRPAGVVVAKAPENGAS